MCDICVKERIGTSNGKLALIQPFIRGLGFAAYDPIKFKRTIIKRCELYMEYNKVWDNKLDISEILTATKNHFPKEYELYGIEKLSVLL